MGNGPAKLIERIITASEPGHRQTPQQHSHRSAWLYRRPSDQCDVQNRGGCKPRLERRLARLVSEEPLRNPGARPSSKRLEKMQRPLLRPPPVVHRCALVEPVREHRDDTHEE